jgi:hypothetical protein
MMYLMGCVYNELLFYHTPSPAYSKGGLQW